MHGLVCQSRAPQGLFSSLVYSLDDSSSIILRECSHHRSPFWQLAKVVGKPSYVMQWLQDAQIDPNLSENSSEEEDEEDEEEDENDLADMVHDFIENGSCCQINNSNSFFGGCSDSDKAGASVQAAAAAPTTAEAIQAIVKEAGLVEREILSHLMNLALSASDGDLFCAGEDCKGGCLDAMAVKQLRRLGYQAHIYTSKWHSNGKLPGGEYKYIDVRLDSEDSDSEHSEESIIRRVIVDLDFRSQFEIARPVPQYMKALRSLPCIFVGGEVQLERILVLMSKAAKGSLNQNAMHLPPWRTLDYMRAKWLTSYHAPEEPQYQPCPFSLLPEIKRPHASLHSQCREQLHRLKELTQEHNTALILKSITNDAGDDIW